MLSEIFSNAWKLTMKFKILWLFGFIVTGFGFDLLLGPPTQPPSLESMQSTNPVLFEPTVFEKTLIDLATNNPKLIIAIIISGLLLLIGYIFLATVSEAALVYGIANHEDANKIEFKALFAKGLSYFWRLLALNFFLFSAYLIMTIVFTVAVVAVIFNLLFIIPLLITLALFIVAGIFLSIMNNYSKRFIVTENIGVWRSISKAFLLLKANKNDTFKIYFSALGLFIAFSIVNGIIGLLLMLPFAFINQGNLKNVALAWLLMLPLALLLRLAGSVLSVFLSALWTLGFLAVREKQSLGSIEEYALEQPV